MMMDSLPRLNTHADPGMGSVSVDLARRGIGESPDEGVGRAGPANADWWARVIPKRPAGTSVSGRRILCVVHLAVQARAERGCHRAQQSRVAQMPKRGSVAAPICFVREISQRVGVVYQRNGIVLLAHCCLGTEQTLRQAYGWVMGCVMNDGAWRARVAQARTERDDSLRSGCGLRKGEHEALLT
jgi:hypothetical protein